jgi:hypothetical protein
MKGAGKRLAVFVALVASMAALAPGTAAAGNAKLIEGTVYDTTCVGITCGCPPPPHCGPVAQAGRRDAVCAQVAIVCPLEATATPPMCVRAEGCPPYPVYSGEGALVNVRKRGSATVIARLPVVSGIFSIRLGPGEYVLHPYLPEEPCWSGAPTMVTVTPRLKSPVLAAVDVSDGCVVHPAGS